ncbi:MBL fold metallo-hydrolase [Terrimonas sp. NA20]|uniref:MBL fold metallo-hydrolase n=1 Tax=Terrimonas ginsenosidimutans TaxID=2908004 RepID=A0ABS9KVE9_9BACT|nr:MBL fold metallo-hydrolase [Terrimonas ginsenosidimutans]MCG2616301.1 MBL fold metallo-hydrolase [Terrimonas ginsenosidimutans]
MKIEQIYTGCLAHGAYYIESDGEAAIVDPLREVDPYIKKAAHNGATIKYVLETHFHADFVSGHLDLAKKTGAKIVYGPTAEPAFDFYPAWDEEELPLGKIKIRVIHTPGHTMESTCYLVLNENGKEVALFSGDTLFIGDVGRPDLAQKVNATLTPEKLAGHLYDSLQEKILPLPDDVIIYPGHGAGSACGKNMSSETTDTLGHQKKVNYALRPGLAKETFIRELNEGLVPSPAYFPANVLMNLRGYESMDQILLRGLNPLDPAAFEQLANEQDALILDTRSADAFAEAFVPGSINIGLDGSFAPWVGTLITDIRQPILLVADEGRAEEVIIRLSRVGYDHVLGYLEGGLTAWIKEAKETDHIERVNATQLSGIVSSGLPANILDVRKRSEFLSEHVVGATNIPLDFINEETSTLDKHKKWFVHCAGGYRSMIFTSILRARGYRNLVDVRGGFKSLKEQGTLKLTEYVCPTTML